MIVTKEQLLKLKVKERLVDKYLIYINASLQKYSINTPIRLCHYFAQVLHESGYLYYNKEIASGKQYEGRLDLGNDKAGDGIKYKGRGLIQLTGKYVYTKYSKYTKFDFNKYPEELETPKYAVDSSCWFWSVFKTDKNGKNLNFYSDNNDFIMITYMVNGGFNGFEDRLNILKTALSIFFPESRDELLEKIKENIKLLSSSGSKTTRMTTRLKDKVALSSLDMLFK